MTNYYLEIDFSHPYDGVTWSGVIDRGLKIKIPFDTEESAQFAKDELRISVVHDPLVIQGKAETEDELPVRVRVSLTCGCTFSEHRPKGMRPPKDGELRACGNPEHYPAQFPATYTEYTEVRIYDHDIE
jgi:hypothetical protein